MSAQQSQGIQTLLDAEKEAAKIVAKAREYRQQKTKDARSEAGKEIEALKAKREQDFAEFEKEHTGSTESEQKEVDEDTAKKVSQIKTQFSQKSDEVVKALLERIVAVEPELHRNFGLTQKSSRV